MSFSNCLMIGIYGEIKASENPSGITEVCSLALTTTSSSRSQIHCVVSIYRSSQPFYTSEKNETICVYIDTI